MLVGLGCLTTVYVCFGLTRRNRTSPNKALYVPRIIGSTQKLSTRDFQYEKGVKQRALTKAQSTMKSNIEQIIANETQRICAQVGKSFLDCEDLAKLTGLGRDNTRALMKSKQFPLITVGRRQVVSVLNFVTWQMKDYL